MDDTTNGLSGCRVPQYSKKAYPFFREIWVSGRFLFSYFCSIHSNVESRLFKTLHSFFKDKAVSAQRYSVFFKN